MIYANIYHNLLLQTFQFPRSGESVPEMQKIRHWTPLKKLNVEVFSMETRQVAGVFPSISQLKVSLPTASPVKQSPGIHDAKVSWCC